MSIIEQTIYITSDGLQWSSKDVAQKREDLLNSNLKMYKIYSNPDAEKGTYSAGFLGYVAVNTIKNHDRFRCKWCFEKFGNQIILINKTYGCNEIIESWKYEETTD